MARDWDGVFFLNPDNSVFAFRAWHHVPRVGDEVVFPSEEEPRKVLRVVWRETKRAEQKAYVECYIGELAP